MKPQMLRPGDKIGIISPSWCGPAVVPHRVENGRRFLESLGYEVVLAPHATGRYRGYLSGTPQDRAADLHAMFADPSVKAIITAIGGDHSCQMLPYIDWELIRRNPKIHCGFSDVTVLNVAIHAKTGLVTFNGPALMVDFAEYPKPFGYMLDSFQRTLCLAEAPGIIEPAPEWAEESLNWATQADLTRPRAMTPSEGWVWLREGKAAGPLIGGCLESMQHLRGTPYWPSWDGAVFFWETSEDRPSPSTIDSILADYENMGVLEKLCGMIVGRSRSYPPEWRQQLREVILERTARFHFPVITEMDFGHTAPQFTLPLGARAEIDTAARRFAITEAAVTA